MRNPVFLIVTSLFLALTISLLPRDTRAQPDRLPVIQNGSDLLAAVNSLRASNGLPAYNANSILMQIAQVHADYMAATGGVYGHVGPGGTSPKDRAIAAGYAATFFSENWQAGSGLSPSGAVSAWQGDAPHLITMLSASLVDAGAGVSKSGNVVYYVLDAGAQGSVPPGGTSIAGTTVPPGTAKPSQFMVPVTISTPGSDGLVYHEVAYGQSLWSIAIAYGTKIDEIRALNNLVNIEIFPGQKLLVLKGPSPVSPTQTSFPTQTKPPFTPTFTSSSTSHPITPTHTVAATEQRKPPATGQGKINLTAVAIVGAALLFAALGTWAGTRKSV